MVEGEHVSALLLEKMFPALYSCGALIKFRDILGLVVAFMIFEPMLWQHEIKQKICFLRPISINQTKYKTR